jgi:tetratricopeptide (TPR) repeat protein
MIMHARQALATVDRGLAAHPDNTKLILAKAFVLDSLNRHADAEACLVTAIAKTGRAASLEWTLSRLMLKERDFAGALPHARIAYDKHPELTDYASQYGMLLNETGHPELALPVLQGLRHAGVRDHFELGRALWLLGRSREAEVEFARARAITPGIAGEIERLQRR